jgi:hypothetical protein
MNLFDVLFVDVQLLNNVCLRIVTLSCCILACLHFVSRMRVKQIMCEMLNDWLILLIWTCGV